MPHRRSLPASLPILAVLVATLAGLGVAVSPPAGADIAADVAAAQARLDELTNRAEIAAEKYNQGRVELDTAERRAAAAQDRVTALTTEIRSLQDRVGAFAAAAYRGGGATELGALTSDDGPGDFLDRIGSLDVVARNQRAAVEAVEVARHKQKTAQAEADAALVAQRRITTDLEKTQASIQADAAEAQRTLDGLKAEQERQAELARQEAARQAAEAARQEAARRAAEQAAAAAALAARSRQMEEAARTFAATATRPSTPRPTQAAPSGGGGAATAVAWAYQQLGKPYVWAAAGPDAFDCSGLTQYVWGKAGVSLDHYTGLQWNQGRHVSRDQLQPGDLVFFHADLHHMGLYVGGGNIIQAPQTGDVVKVTPLSAMPSYAGAVRPLG